jgi:hypothetical protein
MSEPPKEKSVPAERIREDALDEATPITAPSTWLESDLAQNLTALLVAIALIIMSCN